MDSPDMPFILFSWLLSKPDYCIAPQLGRVSVTQPTAPVRLVSAALQATGLAYCDVDTSPILQISSVVVLTSVILSASLTDDSVF